MPRSMPTDSPVTLDMVASRFSLPAMGGRVRNRDFCVVMGVVCFGASTAFAEVSDAAVERLSRCFDGVPRRLGDIASWRDSGCVPGRAGTSFLCRSARGVITGSDAQR